MRPLLSRSPSPRKRQKRRKYVPAGRTGPRNAGLPCSATVASLALTFDDGPDPDWTPRLLDVLAGARARATFFPIAGRAAAQPQLIARMIDEGHGIGLHCDAHIRHSVRSRTWLGQ